VWDADVTSYLKLTPARIILACFVTSSLLLARFSDIDLRMSKLFFDESFYLNARWWALLLNGGVDYFLYATMSTVVGIYAFNRLMKRDLYEVDGRKVLYLLLVLVIGAGLIVNVIFKENFGRARPRDIEEFGGSKHFTPAFVITRECDRNCSFSSGHGAGAFFSVALALALSRKRVTLLAALAFGGLVSFSRVASGAHYFSDSVVSFFVMVIVADLFYYCMFVYRHDPAVRTANKGSQ